MVQFAILQTPSLLMRHCLLGLLVAPVLLMPYTSSSRRRNSYSTRLVRRKSLDLYVMSHRWRSGANSICSSPSSLKPYHEGSSGDGMKSNLQLPLLPRYRVLRLIENGPLTVT